MTQPEPEIGGQGESHSMSVEGPKTEQMREPTVGRLALENRRLRV